MSICNTNKINIVYRSKYLEFLAKRAESESLKSCSSQTVSKPTETETLHGWVYVETEEGEAFFLEATSGTHATSYQNLLSLDSGIWINVILLDEAFIGVYLVL